MRLHDNNLNRLWYSVTLIINKTQLTEWSILETIKSMSFVFERVSHNIGCYTVNFIILYRKFYYVYNNEISYPLIYRKSLTNLSLYTIKVKYI